MDINFDYCLARVFAAHSAFRVNLLYNKLKSDGIESFTNDDEKYLEKALWAYITLMKG